MRPLCLAVALLFWTGPASAAITVDQFKHCAATSDDSFTCTLDSNPTAADVLVMAAGQSSTGATSVTTVTGGCDVAWVVIVPASGTTGFNSRTDVWYCPDATGGATTVTVTWAGVATNSRIEVWELAFGNGFNSGANASNASGYSATTPTIAHGEVTAGSGAWIILTYFINTNVFTVSTPITSHTVSHSGDNQYATYRIGSGGLTVNPTLTLATDQSLSTSVVVLHETAVGGAVSSRRTLTGAGQ